MIILRELHRGILDHFPIRRSEWIMTLPAFGMWLALQVQPDMFSTSPSFQTIRAWGERAQLIGLTPEAFMALVLLSCGVVRLAALTVNGTFHQFRFAPHLRMLASGVGLAVWSQWTLGIVVAWLNGGGSLSGVIVYGTLCVLELANIWIASQDTGGEIKRLVDRRKTRAHS